MRRLGRALGHGWQAPSGSGILSPKQNRSAVSTASVRRGAAFARAAPGKEHKTMSRWNSIGMAVLFAAAAACGGSTDKATTGAAGTPGQAPLGENAQTTLTGCLQPGNQPGSFVLSVAQADDQSARPAGTSGAAGSSPSADASQPAPIRTYVVIAQNANDANANIGARVSVIGVVDTSSAGRTDQTALSAPASGGAPTGTAGSAAPGTAPVTAGAPAAGTN